MANEMRHATVGAQLSQAEFEDVALHIFNSQATGDILYASSATQLTRLGIGAANTVLHVAGGIPEWSATLAGITLTAPTINGTVATTGLTLPAITGSGDVFLNDALGIVIGHTARQTSVLGNDYLTQILGTGAIDTGFLIARYSADSSGPDLVLAKSRHATILSHTVPSLNDLIGRVLFCPSNATNFNDAGAYIAAHCDGASGAGDLPTRLSFWTCPDASASPLERLRITAAGNLEIGGTACVTSFGPAAVASITVKNGLITAIS